MMRRILSMLLCLSLLATAMPLWSGLAEGSELAIEPVAETIRPGKSTLLSFTVPESGTVSLRLVDDAGEILSVVVENFEVAAGRTPLIWNGTYGGVFAPAGAWRLELTAGEQSATTPVTVGQPAPFLTNILSGVETAAQTMTVTFYASVDGLLSVGAVVNGAWTLIDSLNISAGENTYVWDMAAANRATTALTLTLTDATGFPSNEEHIAVMPEDFGLEEEEPVAEPEPIAELEEPPVLVDVEEPAEEPIISELLVDEVMMDDPMPEWEGVHDPIFTPVYGSPYEGTDTTLNYWTMPMDITDEEAVWNVLMQPMTILYSNRDKADRTQVIIREEPDEKSRGLGVVTRINQGVHVLETLDNGWSLIECYSSSFHDSAIQAWNMLVQGYVQSDQLRTVEPQTQYGIVIDKLTQRMYLFKEGHLFSTLLVSTGLTNASQPWNETRSGEFFLTSAVGAFKDGNLTFDMAIRFNSGDLIHEIPHQTNADGSKKYGYGLNELGSKASHGCVRVQRYRTPEGINMTWLWSNRVKNTKLLVWEDWQGRQIPFPDNDLTLYYNPNGGEMYHSQETCYSAQGKTFSPFTYGELERAPFASLKRCPYCAPALRIAEIQAINDQYAPGGDHDPILTEARQKYLNSLGN